MKWVEASLVVDAELAEAVADLLWRHAPGGVALEAQDRPAPGTQAAGSVRVSAFFAGDDGAKSIRAEIERGLWHLSQIRTLPPAAFEELEDEPWAESWKRHYHPLAVGRRLLVLPAWLPDPAGDRLTIRVDPGPAFGTGSHPSTQLCLQLLEDYVQAGDRVVDIGCGSGILSLAAARLGASQVLALDIDEAAVRAASENVAVNDLDRGVRVAAGSLSDLMTPAFAAWRACDLVVANILLGELGRLLRDGLAGVVRPGGTILLSGVLSEQAESMQSEIVAADLDPVERRGLGGWTAWAAKKTAPVGAV